MKNLDWGDKAKTLIGILLAAAGDQIPGYKVNIRDRNGAPLGIVSDRYKVVQNQDAFQFTDDRA